MSDILPSGAFSKAVRLPRVWVQRSIVDRFTKEIRSNLLVEVGGKYTGYISGPARFSTLRERLEALGDLTLEVADYIDDGPGAQRQSAFHLGDAAWQTQEFRRREEADPEIENLGSWHSHHPNGLSRLSSGDIKGYQRTVNDEGHNHDFFFVSLGVDKHGFSTAKHFLFVRGDTDWYEFPHDSISITERRLDRSLPRSERVEDPVDPAGHAKDGRMAKATGASRSPRIKGWSDSHAGRVALTMERSLLSDFQQMRHVLTNGRLAAIGYVERDGRRVRVQLLYPSRFDEDDGLLVLATDEDDVRYCRTQALGLRRLEPVLRAFNQMVRKSNRSLHEQPKRNLLKGLLNWSGNRQVEEPREQE